jgi:hypothetical protein
MRSVASLYKLILRILKNLRKNFYFLHKIKLFEDKPIKDEEVTILKGQIRVLFQGFKHCI